MSKGIFERVAFKVVLISLIPLVIAVMIVSELFYTGMLKGQENFLKNYLNEYAYSVKIEIDLAVKNSSSVLNNSEIINGLTYQYDDDENVKQFEFSSYLSDFVNQIAGPSYNDSIVFYTTNTTLFQSQNVVHANNFREYDDIIHAMEENGSTLLWNDFAFDSTQGTKYITFYRKMLNCDDLVVMRVYMPKIISNEYQIDVQNKSSVNYDEYLTAEINDRFVATIPRSVASRNLNRGTYILFTALVIMVLCAIIWLLSSSIVKKLTYRMTDLINTLRKKDNIGAVENFAANKNDPEELAILLTTLQSFTNTIKESERKIYATEIAKKKLMLNLLQSKIEPHMLYNSLAVLRLQAFDAGDEATIKTIDTLVAYYKLVLNHGKEYTTVDKELELVKKYVYLNEISQEKEIVLELDIMPSLKECEIIQMLLQPFIENAVRHGLAGRNNAKIEIFAALKDHSAIFRIRDNGYGIKPEILDKLKNLEDYQGGYGIKNADQRIKLYYGSNSTVTIQSAIGEGTSVEIFLEKFL